MNLNSCRGCMKEADSEGSLLLPTHQHLRKWVARNLSIKVSENDGLPHRMCWNCLELINTWIRFTLTCRAIQRRLYDENTKVNTICNKTNDVTAIPIETQKRIAETVESRHSEYIGRTEVFYDSCSNKNTEELKNSESHKSTEDSQNSKSNEFTEQLKTSESSKSTGESKIFESNKNTEELKNSESYKDTEESKKSESNKNTEELKNSESNKSSGESKSSCSNKNTEKFKTSESYKHIGEAKNFESQKSTKKSKNSKEYNDFKPKVVITKESSNSHNDNSIHTEQYEFENSELSEEIRGKNSRCVNNESAPSLVSSNRKLLKSKVLSTSFASKKQSLVPSKISKQRKEVKTTSVYCTRNRKRVSSLSRTSCDNKNKQPKVVASSKILSPVRQYELRKNKNNLNQQPSKNKKDISITKKNEKYKKIKNITLKEENVVETRLSKRNNNEENVDCNIRKQPKRDSKKISSDITGSIYDVIINELLVDDKLQRIVNNTTEEVSEPRTKEVVIHSKNKQVISKKSKELKKDTFDAKQQEEMSPKEKKKKDVLTPELTENKKKEKLQKNGNRNVNLKGDQHEIKRRGRKPGKRSAECKPKLQVEHTLTSNLNNVFSSSKHNTNLPLVEIAPESFAQTSGTTNPAHEPYPKKRGRKPGKQLKTEPYSTREQVSFSNRVEAEVETNVLNLTAKHEVTTQFEPQAEMNSLSSVSEIESNPQSPKELVSYNFVEPTSINYTTTIQSYPENLTRNTVTNFQSTPQNLSINPASNIFTNSTDRIPTLVSIKQCNIITYEHNLSEPVYDQYHPPQQNEFYKKAWTPYEAIKPTPNNTREIINSSSANYTNYHTNYMSQQHSTHHSPQYQSYPCRPNVQYQYPNYNYSNYPATISSQTHQSNSVYFSNTHRPTPPPNYSHYPQNTYYPQNPNSPVVSDVIDTDPEKLQIANTMINFSNNVRHT